MRGKYNRDFLYCNIFLTSISTVHMLKYFITAVIVIITITPLSARTIRGIFVQAPNGAPESVFLYSPSKTTEVLLPQRNLSKEVELPKGDLTLALLPKPLPEGAEVPEEAQVITIPASWKRCVIILIPSATNNTFPAVARIIDTSNSNFPKGETLVYNLSNTLFMGKFGGEKLSLRPTKSGRLKAPLDDIGTYDVAIDCILPDTRERKAVCRSRWVHNPNARQLLFVTPSLGKKIPRVWGVLDHRE